MTTSNINKTEIRENLNDTLEQPHSKIIDVKQLIDSLTETAENHIANGKNPSDATWDVIQTESPHNEMSHTERVFTVGFLFTNFGLEESRLDEDSRVKHGETWNVITRTICEYALYQVVHGIVTHEIEPDPFLLGEYTDVRPNRTVRDFVDDMRTAPLRDIDVHNWIASLASDVSTRLANFDEIPTDERTDTQTAITDAMNQTENEAIYDVIENKARDELLTGNIITAASFLDTLENLYNMNGESAIEHEQLTKTAKGGGWHAALTSGLLWHAMAQAIQIHREVFADEFKQTINR